jgi:hypothetical protein
MFQVIFYYTYYCDCRFQVHVLIASGIAYTCVTHLTNKHYLPFSFLETMKNKFIEVPSLHSRAVTASENEFDRDFCPVIASVVVSRPTNTISAQPPPPPVTQIRQPFLKVL